jgi:hypothetical protein
MQMEENKMRKYILTVCVLALAAAPVVALDTYQFVIDPAKSSIAVAVGLNTPATSPLVGTYSLKLDTPSGTFNTRNWSVLAEMDTVNATNTAAMAVSPGLGVVYSIDIGDFGIVDFNQDKGAIPSTTLVADAANVYKGTISTGVHKNILTSLNGAPKSLDTGWQMFPDPGVPVSQYNAPFTIRVSDADWLGVAGTGQLESQIQGVAYKGGIIYTVNICGRVVPEPATLGLLLGLAGLSLLRRRR